MSTTATSTRERRPLNGVDTPNLLGTINVVRDNPPLGAFTFRASNEWQAGTHSRTTLETFSGAGSDHQHRETFAFDADHPAVLVGADNGPTPIEFLLVALASCLTAGIANISAARGVKLTAVRSTVEGDIDLRAILGLTDEVRNGYQRLRAHFAITGEAPAEALQAIVEQSRARSAVFDVLTNGVPVDISVTATGTV